MNLVDVLRKEHSKAMCDRIVAYVGKNPDRFSDLVNTFLEGPYRITQRAGWPLGNCVEKHPGLIRPHLKSLLLHLTQPGHHNSVKRNTVRLLQFIPLPKQLQGRIADICFALLLDSREPIAVRVFSMTVLGRLAGEQPELKRELRLMIEDQLPYASAAFLSRARKVLKQLD